METDYFPKPVLNLPFYGIIALYYKPSKRLLLKALEGKKIIMEQTLFSSLPVDAAILQAVEQMGFQQMTEVQSKAIPPMLTGRDVIAKAPTGTGKTCAFGIPLIQRVDTDSSDVQAIILAPTRELATQICDDLRQLTQFLPQLRTVVVYGGQSMEKQKQQLKKGAQILVATPGRLLDLMQHRSVVLSKVYMAVRDEADKMLDMGFYKDVRKILDSLKGLKQMCMFSATISREVMDISWVYQRDPVEIVVRPVQENQPKISQFRIKVDMGGKVDLLAHIQEKEHLERVIVFCNTKNTTDRITCLLQMKGIDAQCIHGDLGQKVREKVLSDFRSGRLRVLVATDVAARGLDIDDVDGVINYDIPEEGEYYVHRIGRTGRAGHEGAAWSFCSEDEFEYLCDIQKLTGLTIPTEGPVPEYALRKAAPARKPAQKAAQRPARTQEPKPARHAGAKSAQRPARAADAGQQPAQWLSRNTEQKAARNAAKTPQSAQNPAQPEAGATSRPSRPRRRRGTRPAPGTPIEPAGKTASRPADATRGQAPKQGSGNAAKAAGNKSAATAAPKNAPNPAPAPSATPSRRRKRRGSGNAAGSAAAAAAIAAPAATAAAPQKKRWKRGLYTHFA